MHKNKRLILAAPRGFCAGVKRAVEMAAAAVRRYGAPVYCLNEIVHNRQVVASLEGLGVVFVRQPREAPEGAVLLFSAHGVPPEVRRQCRERCLRVIDATCPFVDKVHREVRDYAARGYTILLIGKRGHDEILGVAGEAPEQVTLITDVTDARAVTVPDPRRVALVTQTTLSGSETDDLQSLLRQRFPDLAMPRRGDICYATLNRQRAVRALAQQAPLVLVLGSSNSSNSLRLVEVAQTAGAAACLVERIEQLSKIVRGAPDILGLTAGASVPDPFITEVVARLAALGYCRVEEICVAAEDMLFELPPDLREMPVSR
ncbi:MAG: 4-hydroxy-3-methylbut-2-enyl diphosphate reductase [Kiritimatiellia bacterium]|nr:4-hydroxy-3-methylbut-2-enyl diphosphate reductase [Lentisphaerota bacterium]